MIDRFTKQRFEDVLSEIGPFELEFSNGQWVYTMYVSRIARVLVYSSIGEDDLAKETGEDSIRFSIQILDFRQEWFALGKAKDKILVTIQVVREPEYSHLLFYMQKGCQKISRDSLKS